MNGVALVLYKTAGEIYCSDANSTAYRYPMNDARLFEGPKGPAAECPFDGTTYDLQSGEVNYTSLMRSHTQYPSTRS